MPDSRQQPPPAPDQGALVLCGARLTDGRTVDVRLGGGRIEAVGTAGTVIAVTAAAALPSPLGSTFLENTECPSPVGS
ncbi:hydrolase, partial [Streptomyces seoulensis]